MIRVLDGLYLLVLFLALPWLLWRSWRTGRYRQHLPAKLWGAGEDLPVGPPVVWFHGVSVGEIHLLTTLLKAYREQHPTHRLVISSTTDTGLTEARARFPLDVVIPFPLDFSWAIRATFARVKPSKIILAESELWPNFLMIAKQERIPVVVVNGRMSPRSFARLRRFRPIAAGMLRLVSRFAMQSPDYAARLRELGVPPERIHVTGSVKYDGATADRASPKAVELRRLLHPEVAPILVLGSTHAPEEELLLAVWKELRLRHPSLRLIIVPRHPDRFTEVANLAARQGVNWAKRSEIREPHPEMPAIVVLDTIGELGAAWSLATIGFTGGSLDGHRGGQSMIEPAGYGVPVAFGPHVWNFRDAALRLVEVGGAMMVKTAPELVPIYDRWLSDEAARTQASLAAQEFVREQQGATARTLEVI
ncbi:MAG: 3-deoxy-D-manno-octulosonic acid transferase [Fimbriiglobus sp.]